MGGTAEFIRPLHRFLCKGFFARKMKPCNPDCSGLQGACSLAGRCKSDYRAKPATEMKQSVIEVRTAS